MEPWPMAILDGLARAALIQAVAAGAVAWLERSYWPQHPRECRLACVLIRLQGWRAKNGQPSHRITALRAAVARKQEGLPVVAAAFPSTAPEVRAEVVRTAKAIGGPVAEYAIQMALSDPDESLRKAAEKALQEARAAASTGK